MSFVNRLFSYVFDELMVNALANSRTFQRFAVRSDAFVKDAAKGETMEAAKRAAEEASRRAEAAARTVFEQGRSGGSCLLYTSPSPRDRQKSRMPSSA